MGLGAVGMKINERNIFYLNTVFPLIEAKATVASTDWIIG